MQKYLLEGRTVPVKKPERQTPMNKEAKNAKQKEPLTMTVLLRRNPIPFGDVRKYYYAACIGTVILLTLCFHISVVAVALRTDTCEQLSNVFIVFLLLFCITTIVGHQMRSFLGYGISAVSSLIVLLLLQFYHGTGVMIISDLPEYGEVFRDGAKSTDFWILLAKVFAVIHLLLTIVFINSTLKVKEEPALKGMNIQIQKIKDWLDKNNNSLPPGRRASDYCFFAVSMILYMSFIAYDPSMGKYDYYSLALFVAAGILIACKQTLLGAMMLASSAMIRCTMYQWRNGLIIPVAAAYSGLWIALLYLLLEAVNVRKKAKTHESPRWSLVTEKVFCWIAIVIFVANVPIHEFLSVYSGRYMVYQKDNLPLIFFLPCLIFLICYSKNLYGYLYGTFCGWWLWHSLMRATPFRNGAFFYFDSVEEHGTVGNHTTKVLMMNVKTIAIVDVVMACCMASYVLIRMIIGIRRRRCEKRQEHLG